MYNKKFLFDLCSTCKNNCSETCIECRNLEEEQPYIYYEADNLKIIFLDVDGVLTSGESIKRAYNEAIKRGEIPHKTSKVFPEEYVNNLKEIVDRTGARLVISSSWRLDYPNDDDWIDLIENLRPYGLDEKIIGKTPYLCKKRGDEIREWLKMYPKVTNFVILDDDSDMCEFVETNLAKTQWGTGLTDDVKNKAIEILSRE